MKILHLPDTVGGHVLGLTAGERRLGLDSRTLSLYRSPFGYRGEIELDLQNRGRIGRLAGHLKALAYARTGYDVYHFNYGSSLLHFARFGVSHLDLPLFPRDAIKVFTYQGCDARQKYPTMERNRMQGSDNAACFEVGCYGGMCNSGAMDTWRRKSIDKASVYADHMFALNPDLLYFLPKEKSSFLPYCIAEPECLPRRAEIFFVNDRIRIAHAPTERGAKGSQYILIALERLKERFPNRVEVDLIENVPHREAVQRIGQADLFIDQVLVGWYGAAAVEALSMGVPTAAFINDEHLQFVPQEMAKELPFLRINKSNLLDRLSHFVTERDMAVESAASGRAFAARWHDSEVVARLTQKVYERSARHSGEQTAV